MAILTGSALAVPYYPPEEDGGRFVFTETGSVLHNEELPLGFPKRLEGPLVWRGQDVSLTEGQGILRLSQVEVNHVHEALQHFKALQLGPSAITSLTFPLPDKLAQRLDSISAECHSGRGFCIIRGIDPTKYTLEENIYIFAGLSAYIAPQRGFQDKDKTQVLCHVFNRVLLKHAEAERETPAFTEGPMSFHTDLGEILALYTIDLDDQEKGGETVLASVWQIYNELAATRPDIIKTLAAEDWTWDTYDDYAKRPPFQMPLLACVPGDDEDEKKERQRVVCHCSRYPLAGFGGFRRNEQLPPLTPREIEALNAVHFIAQRNQLVLDNHRGDLLFLNNMTVMHARKALRPDTVAAASVSEDVLSKRHKLKFFLRDEKRSWGCPRNAGWEKVWEEVYGDNNLEGCERKEHWIMQPDRKVSSRWLING